MDINIAVHDLLESGGGGGGAVTIKMLERLLDKALQDYVLKTDFLALEKRVERLEHLLATQAWEVDFIMKYDGTNSIDLSSVLTESQMFCITDEAAGGPEADGRLRTIAVYLVTEDGRSFLLPWGTYGDVNDKSADRLRAAGVNYFPAGLYYLDGEGVLQCNIQSDVHLRIARVETPLA